MSALFPAKMAASSFRLYTSKLKRENKQTRTRPGDYKPSADRSSAHAHRCTITFTKKWSAYHKMTSSELVWIYSLTIFLTLVLTLLLTLALTLTLVLTQPYTNPTLTLTLSLLLTTNPNGPIMAPSVCAFEYPGFILFSQSIFTCFYDSFINAYQIQWCCNK